MIASDIEIDVIPGTLPPVLADPAQIEQVLLNLCLNARDAMPEGGRLLIETEMVSLDDSFRGIYPDSLPGYYVVLSVSDTGIGIPKEICHRIFEPFFTTKLRDKNSGMGLAMAYGIVKQHGGFQKPYSPPSLGRAIRTIRDAEHSSPEVPLLSPALFTSAQQVPALAYDED
jgi:signal transduction histidine kinase